MSEQPILKRSVSTGDSLRVSRHALERFRERAIRSEPAVAISAILAIAERAHSRSTPRHWMSESRGSCPGARYLYNHEYPDLCFVVRNGTVVTIYERSVCAKWRGESAPMDRRPARKRNERTDRRKDDHRDLDFADEEVV